MDQGLIGPKETRGAGVAPVALCQAKGQLGKTGEILKYGLCASFSLGLGLASKCMLHILGYETPFCSC